jgi:hypothetical protein
MKSYYNSDNTLGKHGCSIAGRVRRFIEELYKNESESEYSIRELTGIIMQEATVCESRRVLEDRMAEYKGKRPTAHSSSLTNTELNSSSIHNVIPFNRTSKPKH